jgi:hypothetical protein
LLGNLCFIQQSLSWWLKMYPDPTLPIIPPDAIFMITDLRWEFLEQPYADLWKSISDFSLIKTRLVEYLGQAKTECADALSNVRCGKCPYRTHIQKT